MNTVLVTGGAGYIGTHTVVELVENNYEVVIIDNLSHSTREAIERVEKILGKELTFYENDVRDIDALQEIFSKHSIDAIIHFAAHLLVDESVEKPLQYYDNNLNGLIRLLQVADQFGVKPFVFSSSCTVYGQPEKIPVDESAPVVKAESPYGNTKKIGEEILRDASLANGFRVASLRYFNPIGAHKSGLIGEFHKGSPHLVPHIVKTALGINKKLSVFGGDYDTRDGTCIRDYIHVVDIARAHVNALEYLDKQEQGSFYDVINLGSGEGQTVLEMIRAFESIIGEKLNYEIGPRRAGDVEKVYADNRKAAELLNWKPESGLREMLLSALEWEKHWNQS